MASETEETKAAKTWLTVLAILAIIWNLIGIVMFFRGINPKAEVLAEVGLNDAQIAYTLATPMWAVIANAIAVVTGFGGAVALLLRRNLAYLLFATSLLAIMAVMIDAFLRGGFDIVGGASNGLSIAIIIIAIFLFWTAHIAKAGGALK